MKKYILLILFLVFVAGCVGQRQVKVEANNGLKFVEFSADPRTAEFNDNVLFTVSVENVGGTTADNALLTLFGLNGIWRKSAGINDLAADVTYNFNNDKFEPPVPSQNRPGDLKFFTKTLLPPALPEGVEQDFPVTARMTFKYSTTGSIVIPTISKSLLKIKTDKGEKTDDVPKVTNSDGPLKISLSKGTIPIVVDEKRTDPQVATFVVDMLNVGDGFPVTADKTGSLGQLTGKINVFGPGVTFDGTEGCLGFAPKPGGTEIEFSATADKIDLLKLRSTGRLPLSCTIRIDRTKFTPTTSGIVTFSISMNYLYFIEKTLSVHVVGSKDITSVPSPTPTPTPTPTPVGTQLVNP